MIRKNVLLIPTNFIFRSANISLSGEQNQWLFINRSQGKGILSYRTFRAHLQNILYDTLQGFFIKMYIQGFNYRAELNQSQKSLQLLIGTSHELYIVLPKGIFLSSFAEKGTVLTFFSYNRELLRVFTEKLRKLHKPNVYSGKGIIFGLESVQKKKKNDKK